MEHTRLTGLAGMTQIILIEYMPAQLEHELELDQANQQLVSVTDFIGQVTAHKATL